MNILVIGSGGREHALSWKIAQSPLCDKLYIAPGNAGTSEVGENIDISVNDFENIGAACIDKDIDLVICGPEEPLVKGLRDYFENDERLKRIKFFGPGQKGAVLEGSKDFSKKFMERHRIPTASYRTFTEETMKEGLYHLDSINPPIVLKADGLAAGKGVIISNDSLTAKKAMEDMLANDKFGAAGKSVVVEEFLEGIELSVFIITDGDNYVVLPEAKDYKKIGEGDTGLNTGGMGAVSPVPFMDQELMNKIRSQVIEPTLSGLKAEDIPYTGFIFFGLMINKEGDPFVIEYNARMGDPETEVVLPRITSDLLEVIHAATDGTLGEKKMEVTTSYATTVMTVSGGYPESYEKGKTISGLDAVADDTLVFHAGTKNENNEIKTNGGRVICFTGMAPTMEEALSKSNNGADTVSFDKKYFRTDIGFDLKEYIISKQD